jgi:hypothetical protein
MSRHLIRTFNPYPTALFPTISKDNVYEAHRKCSSIPSETHRYYCVRLLTLFTMFAYLYLSMDSISESKQIITYSAHSFALWNKYAILNPDYLAPIRDSYDSNTFVDYRLNNDISHKINKYLLNCLSYDRLYLELHGYESIHSTRPINLLPTPDYRLREIDFKLNLLRHLDDLTHLLEANVKQLSSELCDTEYETCTCRPMHRRTDFTRALYNTLRISEKTLLMPETFNRFDLDKMFPQPRDEAVETFNRLDLDKMFPQPRVASRWLWRVELSIRIHDYEHYREHQHF